MFEIKYRIQTSLGNSTVYNQISLNCCLQYENNLSCSMPLRMVFLLHNLSYLKVCSLCIPKKEERVIYTLSVLCICLKMG